MVRFVGMYAGKKLRLLREKIGLNQIEFANSVGLSQSYYSAVEAGKRKITPKMIEKIESRWKLKGYFSDENMGGRNEDMVRGIDPRMALKQAIRSNSGYWILFNDELKHERPELAELITHLAQISRFSLELPEVDKVYFKPILDKLDLLTENSYSDYKKQAVKLLEKSLPYLQEIKPVVEILKRLIDNGKFPIPQK